MDLLNQGIGTTRGELVVALDQRFSLFEEKFEHRLAEEVGKVREELRGEIREVREELGKEIGKVREELGDKIGKVGIDAAGSEGRLTRWMFVFWVGQIAVVTGILFAFFRS